MRMLADLFTNGCIRLVTCAGPSAYDLQDTLNTMHFATSTLKVRKAIGPKSHIEGLRHQHIVNLNEAGSLAITRSAPFIAEKRQLAVTTSLIFPTLLELAAMSSTELSCTRLVRLKCVKQFGCFV